MTRTLIGFSSGCFGFQCKYILFLVFKSIIVNSVTNVVVDAVVRHWLLVATQEAERRGERGRERRHQAALFYADDGMIASSDPRWLQWAFTILVGLFDRVGLKKNQRKTVSMACRPCSA